jgi:hypothetical protein
VYPSLEHDRFASKRICIGEIAGGRLYLHLRCGLPEARQGRGPDPAGLQYRSDEPATFGDRRSRFRATSACPSGRPSRLAHVDTPRRTGQRYHQLAP